jgi:hypothetical protein
VLCIDDLPGGRKISLAQFTDGRFGVYVDDAVAAGTLWEVGQLESGIDDYLARKWELKHLETQAGVADA